MKVEVDIPDYIIEQTKSQNISIQDFINRSIHLDITLDPWKKHIELKIAQLQKELDEHRISSKESNLELDSNVTNRVNKERSLLDANAFIDLQQSTCLSGSKPATRSTKTSKTITKTGNSVDMLDLKNLL